MMERTRVLRAYDVPWLWLLPALTAVTVFYFVPIVGTAVYSTFDLSFTTAVSGAEWVGLGMYRRAFSDRRFLGSIGFTLLFTFATVTLDLLLGTTLALAIRAVHKRLRFVIQSLVLIPWAIPPVIHGIMWRWLLNGEAGPVGDLLVRSGLMSNSPLFLSNPILAAVSLVIVFSWRGASIASFFVLAGLSSVPRDLVEAARIDGAGRFRIFFQISLPVMLPVMLVGLTYRAIDAVRVFDIVQSLTAGGPGTATETISSFAYQAFFRFSQFGQASAYSMILFVITMVIGLPLVVMVMRHNATGH